MREIIETQEALKVGASVTLADLEEALRHHVKIKPGKIDPKSQLYFYV